MTQLPSIAGRVETYSGDLRGDGDILPQDLGRHFGLADHAELGRRCLEPVIDGFADRSGTCVLVVDGCVGAPVSHEPAAIALKWSRVDAVLARSVGTRFHRWATDIGMPLVAIGDLVETLGAGDRVVIDLNTGTVINESAGEEHRVSPLPAMVKRILALGDLAAYVRGELASRESDCDASDG